MDGPPRSGMMKVTIAPLHLSMVGYLYSGQDSAIALCTNVVAPFSRFNALLAAIEGGRETTTLSLARNTIFLLNVLFRINFEVFLTNIFNDAG